MGRFGPKSAAEWDGPIMPGARPEPPEDLEPEEAAEWLAITRQLPSDWFTSETVPLLRELCRHIVYARGLAKDITRLKRKLSPDEADRKELRALLDAHGSQSSHIATLSTRLKLTKQSRYARADAAGSATRDALPGRKPWEDWRDDRRR